MILQILLILAIIVESFLAGPILAYVNTEIVQGIMDRENIYLLISSLLGIFLLLAFSNAFQTIIDTYYKKYLTIRLQNMLFKRVCNTKDFSTLKVGESFAHIDQNAEVYCTEKTEILKRSSKSVCLIIFSGVYIWRLNISLMVFSYLLVGIMVVLNYITTAHIGVISKTLNENGNELVKYRWEMIKNSEIANTLIDKKVLKKYLDINQDVYQLGVMFSRKMLFSSLVKRYGYLTILAAVSIFGGLLSLKQFITLAELFGIIVLLPRLTNAFFDLPKILTDYSANQGLKNSIDIIFSQSEYSFDGKVEFCEKVVSITCTDIVFSFTNKMVLDQLTYQFQQNYMYIITGVSGGGKSTLLRLLCQSLLPKSGIIKLNSIPLNTISRDSIWKFIFYAPQNCIVFPTTLRKNITCNQEDDVERIYQCLEGVNLKHFRIDLDEEVDIESLSAGEKQKIVFARALYQRKDIMLLDEPTSAMDPVSEEICLSSLYHKTHEEHIITIVISHNKYCEKFADTLCSIEDGKLRGALK